MANTFLGGEIPPGFQAVPKVDAEGNALYLLPQAALEVRTPFTRREESTVVSDEPVMVHVTEYEPVLNADGTPMSYVPTRLDEETGEMVPSGPPLMVRIAHSVEAHKATENGDLFYWHMVTEERISYVPRAPLEITENDERYIGSLEPAYELVLLPEEPPQPIILTPDQMRLANLEEAQRDLRKDIQINGEKVDATTGTVGDFMDFYFSQ